MRSGQTVRFFYLTFLFIFCLFRIPSVFAQEDSSTTSGDSSSENQAPAPVDINLQGQLPRAEFALTTYDFGNIYRGQKVHYSFQFQNTGNGILVFSSIHAVCGCIDTRIYADDGKSLKNTFKPNEKGMVTVLFDSKDFVGMVVRPITIETNTGSSSPTITLKIMTNVLEELTADPPLIYLGNIQENLNREFDVNIRFLGRANNGSENKEPLKISSVDSNVPFLKPTFVPASSSRPAKVHIKMINKSLPIGPIFAKISVLNNSTFYQNYEIPVVGENVGNVQISAKYVEFGVVSENKPATRSIVFKSVDKNFVVTSVKINLRGLPLYKDIDTSELFAVKKEKILSSSGQGKAADQSSYKVSFELLYPKKFDGSGGASSASGTNVSGSFLVTTNDPDNKEIEVPFFGVLGKNK